VRARLCLWALALVACAACLSPAAAGAGTTTVPTMGHVFVIVLENESADTTFGPGSPAPYLSKTLTAQGAYLPNYHATGHESNDNYIAMISGQAPNADNQADCQHFDNVIPGTIGSYGQAEGIGCVYPAAVPTIADQLTAHGLTWRGYEEDMGADPSRESAVCGHPAVGSSDNTQSATAADEYAARHDPFVYFHSIIDDTTLCDTHVVGLDALPQDLQSVSTTPNYSFITPDLCNDGHDSPCKNGQPGGLASADEFLQNWVPKITASPAFQQNGLLIVTFDEADTDDASDCCGEIPGPGSPLPGVTGPGGGDIGAVLLSPCITPGTVSMTPYNHYVMLGSIENLFGLAHLGYAALPGETDFGSDIYNHACGATAAPPPRLRAPALASTASTRARITVRWTGTAADTLQVRDLSAPRTGWRTLTASTPKHVWSFAARLGHTYAFRVAAAGTTAFSALATTVVPSGVHPSKGHYSRGWKTVRRHGAWQGRAIQSARRGATFSLRYRGGAVSIIGELTARGGRLRVTLDGHARTLRLHASRLHRRRTLTTFRVAAGTHRLRIRVLSGLVALEGYGIASRTG
jgi:hypothetical protein